MSLTQRQQHIKDEFTQLHGVWDDAWEDILRLDPEFLASYLQFSAVPWRKNHLDDRVKELIYLAVDANATHMYRPGVRQHIQAALKLGATKQELMEVLELSATLSIHVFSTGLPILIQVLEERGMRTEAAPRTEAQERVKAEFSKSRGYWSPFWDDLLDLDPELFAAYTNFSAHPWRHGTLEPKIKEFIYIAFDATATHLYEQGLKVHIENALGYGATAHEILEVMEIASALGMHAVNSAAPILAELAELAELSELSEQPAGQAEVFRTH
jgi:alkylhydroperoxidase/carboxymuconolactone decarboxylase family protein YurZ